MPYNYVLDPKIRRTEKLKLSGNILIIDEAHNVPETVEEMSSFELSTDTFKKANTEISTLR